MNLQLRLKKNILRKILTCALVPLVATINMPLAALAAPQPLAPQSVPNFSQTPKSVRIGPRSLKPVKGRTLSAHPSDIELANAHLFEEPLAAMSGTSFAGENDELAKALLSFKSAKDLDNTSALTDFLTRHPNSRWAPSLKLNVGLLRFQSGYLSEALQLWTSAWNSAKGEKGAAQKAIADRAIAEVLLLNARLGRMSELEKTFAEIKGRPLQGSTEQKVRAASDGLVQMSARPEVSFKCGPWALSNILVLKRGKSGFSKRICDYPSTTSGTSLQQLKELADLEGLPMQVAKRSPGAPLVVPSILHWKLSHFAAVTSKVGDRFEIKDATFGLDGTFKVKQAVFDKETDGYALIPAGALPSGWSSVSAAEASKIFGKGAAYTWPDSMPCNSCNSPGPTCGGMMRYDANLVSTDLHLYDAPLSYQCPIGGTVDFRVDYNYLDGFQPSSYTFTTFGPNWAFNHLSYLSVNGSGTATVRLRGGHSEVYPLSAGVYKRDRLSLALLVDMGSGVYQRQLTDGSIEQYDLADGASPPNIFMTKMIDAQGNQTLIQYDSDFRITTITDPIGQVSNLSYVSNTFGNSGFYKVSQISDPFSRTCAFSYDSSNTNLMMVTDVIGMQSKMTYDLNNTFITSLQSPYGTSSFTQYVPTGNAANSRGLKITYPDGSTKVLESWLGHDPLHSTFVWDREAMERYPDDFKNHDFTHADKTSFLYNPADGILYPIIEYTKPPLENRTFYNYNDELGYLSALGPNTIDRPIKISRPAATPILATIGGTKTTSDVLTLTFTNTDLPSGSQAIAYTVQSADTLATIASGLAAAVNANANLQKLGVTAAATGTKISLVTQSPITTVYSKSLSGGATETISLASSMPQSAQVTISGTATSGNWVLLALDVNGSNLGWVQYVVQPGDTLANVATGLKNLINGSSIFTNRGLSANSFGAKVFVSSSTTTDVLKFSVNSVSAPLITLDYQSVAGEITSTYQYNSLGHRTLSVDPAGRVFEYTFAGNGIDLTQITEVQNGDSFMLGNWTYNGAHRPTQYIDGSARQWDYTYNGAGQITSMSDPNSNTTALTYTGTSNAFLTQINGPLSGNNDITTFTFDGFNRLDTTTDSEGYQLSFDYDNFDRKTQTTYPDGTTEQTVYDKLDAVFTKDRIGRWSQSSFDSLDQLSFEIDPLGRKTQYSWCHCGSLSKLTDPAGNVTKWHHDLQGRKIEKVYADQTAVSYAYESGAGRMLSRKDALNQTTNYFLNSDGTTFATGYQNAVNPTSAVINTFDNKFSRISSVQNDWGTISYSYNNYVTSPGATPTTGGGRLSTVQNNVIANSDITYQYDLLGRTTNRSIDGANNSITWAYDAMSRVTSEQNALGTFNYSYVDDTPGSSKGVTRLASVAYPNSQVTNYDWYGNSGDQRLKTINNLNPSGGTLSRFDYKYNPAGEILQWQQQQNGGNDFHNFKYDLAGQLVSDQVGSGAPQAPFSKEFYYAYDKAANRIGVQSHSVDTLRVSGTVTASDILTVTVKDAALGGGQQAINYTVQGGDTLSTIAQGIATAINTNTNLQAIGVAANAQSGKTFVNIRAASSNITTYVTSTSGGATEVLSLGIWKNGLENAVVGGTKTTGDIITLTFKDIALSGGTRNVAYTVQAGDNLTTIASNMAAAINADTPLQNLGVSATSVGSTLSIASNSINVTSYSSSLSVGATETIALSINQNSLHTATIAGTKTTGDTITITVYDSALGGGSQAVTYTVQSGDNLTSIATGVAGAINGNGNLQAIAVSATSSGNVVTIQSKSVNATTYRASTSSAATENVTMGVPVEAWTVAAIGGSKTTGNVLTITTFDAGLPGGNKSVGYTVQSGDTLTSIATNFAAALTADSDLQAIGVSATANSTVISLKSTSPNLTTFARSLSSGATETIVLSSSTSVVQSVVNNVNELVALAPGGKTKFQGSTNKPIVSAAIFSQVVQISQKALAPVQFETSIDGTATATLTLGTNVDGNITVTVGGTVTPGEVISVIVHDIRFNNGPVTCSYTAKSGDTTTTIAAALVSIINAKIGNTGTAIYPYQYYASNSGPVITINPYFYYADVIYSKSVKGVATETLTSSANFNGNTTITVGGTPTVGDVVNLAVDNDNLSGGSLSVSYTVAGGNTTTDIATELKNAINASSPLQNAGMTATSAGAVVTVSTAGTTYSLSTSGGATETLTPGTNADGNLSVVVGGKATNGDTVTVQTNNPLLPGGQQSSTYTVGASDTLVEVAAGLAAAINGNSNLQGLGVTAKNSEAAELAYSQSFSGNGEIPSGASLAKVSATDAVPATKTDTNALNVTASASSALTWDANGNMTSDGTNTYKWDAENRLIEIDYPGIGNRSEHTYDGIGRNVRIEDYGATSNARQYLWTGQFRVEMRNGFGGSVSKFYERGEINNFGNRFSTFDHLTSTRETTDGTGNLVGQYAYSSFGTATQLIVSEPTSFEYAGYYKDERSNLCLTLTRPYSANLGIWMARDMLETSSGFFAYVGNNPISFNDPPGTYRRDTRFQNCLGHFCGQDDLIEPMGFPFNDSLEDTVNQFGIRCFKSPMGTPCKCRDDETFYGEAIAVAQEGRDPFTDPYQSERNVTNFHFVRGQGANASAIPGVKPKGKDNVVRGREAYGLGWKNPKYSHYCCCKKKTNGVGARIGACTDEVIIKPGPGPS